MKNSKKWFPIRIIIVISVLIICFVSALVIAAVIPQKAIKKNIEESADYLCSRNLFFNVLKEADSSRIDRYADSILLGIAWQYDAEHPLESVMNSSYYTEKYLNENEALRDAVEKDKKANQQYLRYWHGSIAVVRPLLMLFSVKGIYVFNRVLLVALTAVLLIFFIRERYYAPMVGMITAMIMTSVWFVPLSLEYTWTVMLMLIFTLAIAFSIQSEKKHTYYIAFLCFGMITCYFDFLTTETLTLTVPMLVLIWLENKIKSGTFQKDQEDTKALYVRTMKRLLMWAAGYIAAWVMKWGLAAIILRENVMPYITGHLAERIGGTEHVSLGLGEYLIGAIIRNIRCLLPFNYGIIGILTGFLIILVYLYIAYVYRGENINRKRIGLYLIIAAVPYIRYMVLHNHSYLHYFFTYRAQLGTVIALVLILDELRVWDSIRRLHRHGR